MVSLSIELTRNWWYIEFNGPAKISKNRGCRNRNQIMIVQKPKWLFKPHKEEILTGTWMNEMQILTNFKIDMNSRGICSTSVISLNGKIRDYI